MKNVWFVALAFGAAVLAPQAVAQGPTAEELEIRARALATRRAERDRYRSENAPSRPITLRDPVPLPVLQSAPPGGEPAAGSCPAEESCKVEFAVPAGKVLVVTALWSAAGVRCDGSAAAATPPSGQAIAPWWQCRRSLEFTGKGAGFAGFLAPPPPAER